MYIKQYHSEENQSLSEYVTAETRQRQDVQRQIAQVQQEIRALGIAAEFLNSYDTAFSGFSVKLPKGDVEKLCGCFSK